MLGKRKGGEGRRYGREERMEGRRERGRKEKLPFILILEWYYALR